VVTAEEMEKTSVLETRRWGKLAINFDELIQFPRGILGFDQFHQFSFFAAEEIKPFQWLISIDQTDLGFVVVVPQVIYPDFNPKIYKADLQELKVEPTDQLSLFVIVTLAANPLESTANLQGPLLINTTKKIGKQIIVVEERYTIKFPIINANNNGGQN